MAAATASFTFTRLISSTKSFSISNRTSFLPTKTFRSNPKPLKFSAFTTKISATIAVGDTLPEATFSYFDPEEEGELKTITVSELTKGKKTVLAAVPGAFTPTCSLNHVPGFADLASAMKAKGVDIIAVISVNDAFVMKAWKKDFKVVYPTIKDVMFLSDGLATFTKAIGCELDLTDNPVGLGLRSRRYAMIVEDGVVKTLNLEKGGALTSSAADFINDAL